MQDVECRESLEFNLNRFPTFDLWVKWHHNWCPRGLGKPPAGLGSCRCRRGTSCVINTGKPTAQIVAMGRQVIPLEDGDILIRYFRRL
jgi:hypothetical protein